MFIFLDDLMSQEHLPHIVGPYGRGESERRYSLLVVCIILYSYTVSVCSLTHTILTAHECTLSVITYSANKHTFMDTHN